MIAPAATGSVSRLATPSAGSQCTTAPRRSAPLVGDPLCEGNGTLAPGLADQDGALAVSAAVFFQQDLRHLQQHNNNDNKFNRYIKTIYFVTFKREISKVIGELTRRERLKSALCLRLKKHKTFVWKKT